ncbi:3-phosphoshikimate 1-carboxyvinyltransferase [Metallosphaera tengchongensis]|uniref:3-phosphoshikimate 1-carboxyvinyltransferase n=1 Tax=Metallosphaera tengchongensis TaxID=1532350 RepID=A0A6N0NTE6_9CREN|nr:3-phosphoshikimate 1-carboxyvinyltransferase [Metallosphaera tengchongensis]QKQ99464.1 3-phosphoshikimate 1-carboxyvinyltransferase [Metallosphaera tengchongensis]
MIVEIEPSVIRGEVEAPPSKSYGIRYVLLSLLTEVRLENVPESDDVKVALNVVRGIREGREELHLGGSATTLRMIIPILLTLGRKVKLDGDETLRRRPLNALRYMRKAKFSSNSLPLVVEGQLEDETEIEGWESSQYISGLIYAYCLKGGGRIRIIPPISSKGYIHMTAEVINMVGGKVRFEGNVVEVQCSQLGKFQGKVPGDYALASFYANGAILTGGKIKITNLYPTPNYFGDHVIVNLLKESGARSEVVEGTWEVEDTGVHNPLKVSVNDVPDLAPSLAVIMAISPNESVIEDVQRLRTKESDRVETITLTLRSFGVTTQVQDGKIRIIGGRLRRGEVDCPKDHRIAMMAGDLALNAGGKVLSAECVKKSNPKFWDSLAKVGALIKVTP